MSLYPPIEPFHKGTLAVSEIHTLYYEQCGNPDGFPIVFLHGGPGGGIGPDNRRFFDPSFYHIILFDQRGAGKSTPHASLEENTTWHLVADIERLRLHIGVDKWAVFGGSWGSTLSLAYAETHPERVAALILRGIFTLRRKELLFFYQEGASFIMPDHFDDYLAPIPEPEHGDLIGAYYRRLTGTNREEQLACAQAWSRWEMATCKLFVDKEALARSDDPRWALAFARIECHYFAHGGFFKRDGQLIEDVDRIRHIPTTIVQGRYDLVCPMKTAWDLHKAFPEAKFIVVDDAGHSAKESGIEAELVKACDNFRDDVRQGRIPQRQSSAKAQSQSAAVSASLAATPARQTRQEPYTPAASSVASTRLSTPQRDGAAGVRMSEMRVPAARFHTSRQKAFEQSEGDDEKGHLSGAMHKMQLQPPGGRSHNIFG